MCLRPAAAACSCRCASRRRFFRSTATSSAFRPPTLLDTPRYQGTTSLPASTRTTSCRAAVKPGSAELEYYPLSLPLEDRRPGRVARLRRLRHPRFSQRRTARRTRDSLSARSISSRCGRPIPDLVRAIWFGMFAFLCVPLLSALNWVNGVRRQLRLVDHRAHGHHQRGDVPASAQEQRVDAEDAGDPAAGEGDSGSLREAESDRSRRGRR